MGYLFLTRIMIVSIVNINKWLFQLLKLPMLNLQDMQGCTYNLFSQSVL